MLGQLKYIYKKFPTRIISPFIRVLGLTPAYSRRMWNKISSIENDEELNFNVEVLLKGLVDDINKVSYYKKDSFENFKNEANLKSLRNLPLLDTEIVRNNVDGFINKAVSGYTTSTGGSGRNPLKIYLSNHSYFEDRKFVFYAWSKLGYKRNDLKLTLRGVNLGTKLIEYNPMNNELNVNVFLMNNSTIVKIIQEINKWKPTFGHGYPSAWFIFTSLLREHNLELKQKLDGIYFASESINEQKRTFVESFFEVDVRGTYGLSERSGFAFEKKDEKGVYKVMLEYGLIEIIKKNGNQAGVGETGEIVSTGFINRAMPLVRYRTGDFAEVVKIENKIVVEFRNIIGRWGKDFILDKERNKIYTTSVNIHSSAQFDFRYIQIKQDEPGKIHMYFVPFSGLNEKSLVTVKKEFQRKLSNIKIESHVIEFEKLYKTERGKIPFLIKST